jgi:plasmid maintenance system antidote protein VapI
MREDMSRIPIHPGEILGDELGEIGLSARRLAEAMEVPPNRLYQLLAGKRSRPQIRPFGSAVISE